MNEKVLELVEWVAKTMQDRDAEAGECYACWDESVEATRNSYKVTAKRVLSHPDLALIDREKELPDEISIAEFGLGEPLFDRGTIKEAGFLPAIPLAEEVKK